MLQPAKISIRLIVFGILFFCFGFAYSQENKIEEINISKDSNNITAFLINNRSNLVSNILPVVSLELLVTKKDIKGNTQNIYLKKRINSINKIKNGIKISVVFENSSTDTINLKNIIPFSVNPKNVYITGNGEHALSRTHLFVPNKQPVNVIVPDNAWEMGFNTIHLKDSIDVFGFSRRNRESLKKGRVKRFETMLYPGGSIQYTIWMETFMGDWQNGLLKIFRDRKLYDVENFEDSLYHRPDLQWIRNAYTMHLMMCWDKFFYDPIKNKYLIDDFVARGNKLYGGDDIISIWPTWPTLGLDQRNQFDLFNDLPGGLDSIKSISDYLSRQKKHLFVSYNPWDVDTRTIDHYKGLSWLIDNTKSDGVVLDTQGSSSVALQNAADSVRKGVIMYSEGMAVPKDMQGIIAGRVHNALYYPPMLNLNKYIQPGFAIFRVAELYKEPINREFCTSFFNGYGTELNIMAPGQPAWVEQQYELLFKTSTLLKQLSDHFNSSTSKPLIETIHDSIWVNEWPTNQSTVYTIYSMIPEGFQDLLFEVKAKENWHFVDLYHHKLLSPVLKNSKYFIEVETDAFHKKYLGTNNEGAVDCILHAPKLINLIRNNNLLTIKVDSNFKAQNKNCKINIYKSNPSPANKPFVFNYADQIINIENYFNRFEGSLIVQVVQNSDDREILLDEDIVELPAGEPRLNAAMIEFKNDKLMITKGMVSIPSGSFIFKQTHGDDFIPYPTFTDSSIILLNHYWMDKYPVTNKQFFEFINASNYSPTDKHNYLKHWVNNKPLKEDQNKPVVNISYEDASAFAKFYNKSLPTEIEWQYAAQTSALNEWPWKQDKPVTRTCEEITSTLSVAHINGIDSGLCNLGNGILENVGAHPRGINPFGLEDLVGSVWQYTQDIYTSGSYQYIILKGGSYYKPSGSWWYVQSGPRELTYAQYLLRVSQGFERNNTVGFRCVIRDLSKNK